MQLPTLRLGLSGFEPADLHEPGGLERLFAAFRAALQAADPALAGRYEAWREDNGLPAKEESELLIAVARHVSAFLGRLFGATAEMEAHRLRVARERRRFAFRTEFVTRRAARRLPDPGETAAGLQAELARLLGRPITEEVLVEAVLARLAAGDGLLDVAERYVAACLAEGCHPDWPSLHLQHKVNFERLVPTEPAPQVAPGALVGPRHELRPRDGFALTDDRGPLSGRLGQLDTCLVCHERGVDSCRLGLRAKGGAVKSNPLGIPLKGCPLQERISEAHELAEDGDALGSLALVVLDNPMCPGTGHRICNDCMKACIFQAQEPVDIPRIETGTLTDVLALPWGPEIYGLLTRWNPLNRERPYALPYNGLDVLVVGMGPAGYTLAHYLLNEGFGVVGIDGLKIEPLPEAWSAPLCDWSALCVPLDERVPSGFGGVSEYGITVRWDKNFLRLIQLTLARRAHLRIYGGVRFGGTLTLDDAWDLGFAHVAMASGAGKPTLIGLQNNLTRGVRKASDFLMSLQLSGAFQQDALANLQVELPALVVGGGLTAIDTATEALAYYPVQVERVLRRHELLEEEGRTATLLTSFLPHERATYERFLEHGRAIRGERDAAAREGRPVRLLPLLERWGGVAICYRKGLSDSPAYRLNHEEVVQALREGIAFVEGVTPVEALDDEHDGLSAVSFERSRCDEAGRWVPTGGTLELPARSLFIAAGTSPNTIYERERPNTFALDRNGYFLAHDGEGRPDPRGFFTSYRRPGRRVSFYGDNHPAYAGSVVKAMASARDGHRQVVDLFRERLATLDPRDDGRRAAEWRASTRRLDELLRPVVVRVDRLTPTIVDVIVRAPLAARRFAPGQFFRLQNYEAGAEVVDGTRLVMEGLALTGAWVDREQGLLSLIVLEMGGSSSLCARLRPGEPVVVMGPTGTPTEIPHGEDVLLVGGGLGNAVLFSIAAALKQAGNRVLYVAGYRHSRDLFKREQIEAATDVVAWCADAGPDIAVSRPGDRFFRGNIVQAIEAYGSGRLGAPAIPLQGVRRIICIGSDRMMAAVARARHGVLAPLLGEHVAIASINSPMQCMLKEVCAQCLQRHVDPATGAPAEPVFTCFNQDQLMDRVDWSNLGERLATNGVLEKATSLWLARLLGRAGGQGPAELDSASRCRETGRGASTSLPAGRTEDAPP